jgi:hypothetical protein
MCILLTAWQQTEFSDGKSDLYLLHLRRHRPDPIRATPHGISTHHLTAMARLKGSVHKKAQKQQQLKSRFEADETRALSESARVYCAGYHYESNKATKEYQRDKKAFMPSYTESDTSQRAQEARRAEHSRRQAKTDRRNSRTVGLPPHKIPYRIFKLRFHGSSYQRACDPHHIDNLDFGLSVKENDS